MTQFEDVLETILEEYARRDSEGEFDTWEETDAFVKEKAEVLLAYVKEEPVSEDLEEAANAYISNENNYSHSRTDTFKAGARWQKEKDDEEKVLTYKHGFEDCKEQMMKEAVESKVTITSKGILLEDLRIEDFDYEDKVKLIIIKED